MGEPIVPPTAAPPSDGGRRPDISFRGETTLEALSICTCHGPRGSGIMPADAVLDILRESAFAGDGKFVPILFGCGRQFSICITLGEELKSVMLLHTIGVWAK